MVQIEEVTRHENSEKEAIFAVRFSDGEFVALQRNRHNRYSRYDGCWFTAWYTNEEFFERGQPVDSLPEGIEVDEIYTEVGTPTREMSEDEETEYSGIGNPPRQSVQRKYLEAIQNF